jgi:hypothetical protein
VTQLDTDTRLVVLIVDQLVGFLFLFLTISFTFTIATTEFIYPGLGITCQQYAAVSGGGEVQPELLGKGVVVQETVAFRGIAAPCQHYHINQRNQLDRHKEQEVATRGNVPATKKSLANYLNGFKDYRNKY